jgi:hypothetical protein
MTVYVALFSYGGPWLTAGSADHRSAGQIVIAIVLAVLAARGSRTARVLMITYSVMTAVALFSSTARWGPSRPFAASFLGLACAMLEIGLLVSTPMYQRTRPGWSPGQLQSDPFLPWPRWRALLAGAGGGVALALVPFSDGLRETLCPAGAVRAAQSCEAAGFGYPIAYRFGYDDLAPRGLDGAAFAADWALWGLSIVLVLYLLQLSRNRGEAGPDERPIMGPVPAGS